MLIDFFRLAIGIDFGSSNTLAGVPGKGIIFDEPTLVARQKKKFLKNGSFLAFGKKAKEMVGKEPKQIEVVEPIVDGAIADLDAAIAFFNYLFGVINELPSRFPRLLKPLVVISVSTETTEVERRAVKSAAIAAGAGAVFLAEKPVLAAIGMGLAIEKPAGNLLLDIGGGTTEIALLSLGGIVLNRCLKIAGKEMDEAIVSFLRLKYGVLIGLPTAEKIKVDLGSVLGDFDKEKKIKVKGRDLETGLPKIVLVGQGEVREAISPIIQEITTQLLEVLEEAPPELTADVAQRGIAVCGGGSLLNGIEKKIAEVTKMPVWKPDNPLLAVVKGCLKVIEDRRLREKVMVTRGLR